MEQGGFILIVVMAMMSVLAVLSMQYSRLGRQAADLTRVGVEDLEAFYVAESGVERAKALLGMDTGSPDAPNEVWNNPSLYSDKINNWALTVTVTDESAKLNLNTVSASALSELLKQFDLDKRVRDRLSASLLDWIDSNELHRTNGAESGDYRTAGYPYDSKNAPLDSVEELLRVFGAPADLLDRTLIIGGRKYSIAECVTVVGDTRVNVNTAPAPVLLALGFTEDEATRVLETRVKSPWSDVSAISSSVLSAARLEVLKPYLKVSTSWFLVEARAIRSGASGVSVFARFRRSSGRIYTAAFWT